MAQKRMFDKALIDTDRFMDLPMSAKALYFLMGMEADDEGFVSYKKVLRIHGGNEDDCKILTAKGFTIAFPSGVMVITDWNKNNYLDKNKVKPTEYQIEKAELYLTETKEYRLTNVKKTLRQSRVEQSRVEQSSIEYISSQAAEKEVSINEEVAEQGSKPQKQNTRNKANNKPSFLTQEEISSLIDSFEPVNPSFKRFYSNISQRTALHELAKAITFDKLLNTVKALPSLINQPYCPKITTPCELQNNIGKLVAFYKQQQQLSTNKTNIII